MPIRVTLDQALAAKHMTAKELAARIGVTETHLSLFRCGKVRGVRFSTLAKICAALDCQPGDLMVSDHATERSSAKDRVAGHPPRRNVSR